MTGYGATPLIRKLGLKEGYRVRIFNAPEDCRTWLSPLPAIIEARVAPYDFVHVFTNQIDALEKLLHAYRQTISPDGMLWVSWYKKSSGLPSEITEDPIRATAMPLGLVEIKVCAATQEWSGLKLVIRRSMR